MVSKRWHKLHQIIGMSTFSVDLVLFFLLQPKVLSLLPMIDQVNHRSGVRSQFFKGGLKSLISMKSIHEK